MIGGLGLVGARSGPVDGLSTMGYVLVCVIYCSLIVVSSLGVSTGGRGDVWVVLRCRNRKNLRGGETLSKILFHFHVEGRFRG